MARILAIGEGCQSTEDAEGPGEVAVWGFVVWTHSSRENQM